MDTMNSYEPELETNECFSMTYRKASACLSAIIIIIFMSFVAGYIWGKRNAIELNSQNMTHETFADEVSTSLFMHNNIGASEENSVENNNQAIDDYHSITVENEKVILNPKDTDDKTFYFAPLIGYGTLKAAELFVDRWKKKGIDLFVLERKSFDAKKKKTITWYQVITEKSSDKEKIESIITTVTSKEKLGKVSLQTTN